MKSYNQSRNTQLHEHKDIQTQSCKLKTHRKTTKFKHKHIKLKHGTKKNSHLTQINSKHPQTQHNARNKIQHNTTQY